MGGAGGLEGANWGGGGSSVDEGRTWRNCGKKCCMATKLAANKSSTSKINNKL